MSVCFMLLKVNPHVNYCGNKLEDILYKYNGNIEEIEDKLLIHNIIPEKEIDQSWETLEDIPWEIFDKYTGDTFSDGEKHFIIDFATFNTYRNRKMNRIAKDLKKKFGCKKHKNKNILIFDEVAYFQGWYLKNSWFRKDITVEYRLTKKGMNDFFKKYLDTKSTDPRMKEIVNNFNRIWGNREDILFYVSF